jgi:hypothetical protein
VDVRHKFRRPEYYFRREPVWLSLPERRQRRIVDEVKKRIKRDRGGVLVAELIDRSFCGPVQT